MSLGLSFGLNPGADGKRVAVLDCTREDGGIGDEDFCAAGGEDAAHFGHGEHGVERNSDAAGALPGLAWTSVLGLYAIVLVVIGLPRLMRCAADRALGYGASTAVVMAAIGLAISMLTSRMLAHS